MILYDIVCFCSLDTRQENYDFGDFSVLVRQNIEMTPIKLIVGKWQATKLPGSWIRGIAQDKCRILRVEWKSS